MTTCRGASVVIAAHDEAEVIGALLRSLEPPSAGDDLDLQVLVVCNGCTDDTAATVRSVAPWVDVVELAKAGKAGALQRGDALATTWPRFYIDADVRLGRADLRRLVAALEPCGSLLAAGPRVRYDVDKSSRLVRAYYRASALLPAYEGALFGTGVLGVSRRGRERFDRWPEVIADDFFFDAQFSEQEKARVTGADVCVVAPRGLRDLTRRKTRVRAGNQALLDVGLRAARPRTGVTSVVRRHPERLLDVLVFVAVGIWCRGRARLLRRRGGPLVWARDASRSTA